MDGRNPWWAFRREVVETEQDAPGVYELEGGYGEIIYIGGSAKLRSQLQAHLQSADTSCLRQNAVRYRVEYTKNFARRVDELMSEHVRRHNKRPLCQAEAPNETSDRHAA